MDLLEKGRDVVEDLGPFAQKLAEGGPSARGGERGFPQVEIQKPRHARQTPHLFEGALDRADVPPLGVRQGTQERGMSFRNRTPKSRHPGPMAEAGPSGFRLMLPLPGGLRCFGIHSMTPSGFQDSLPSPGPSRCQVLATGSLRARTNVHAAALDAPDPS